MAGRLYMDAVITLNRSLSPGGFKVLFGVVVTVNVLVGVFFFSIGAWPAPIFLGLDVLLVWLAFRASFRASERAERVQVSAEEVTVTHDGRTVWRSPTAFTRVDVEERGEGDRRVRLRLSGRAFTVARSLSPGERRRFAAALQDAIRDARAERF
ncbi:MAG TPA: DUF2244 domain-containing protein [Caulobacteraceae bacterium]|nr:DUF2244 domain-containing protein [Caulobacteraceae bacterium]